MYMFIDTHTHTRTHLKEVKISDINVPHKNHRLPNSSQNKVGEILFRIVGEGISSDYQTMYIINAVIRCLPEVKGGLLL